MLPQGALSVSAELFIKILFLRVFLRSDAVAFTWNILNDIYCRFWHVYIPNINVVIFLLTDIYCLPANN